MEALIATVPRQAAPPFRPVASFYQKSTFDKTMLVLKLLAFIVVFPTTGILAAGPTNGPTEHTLQPISHASPSTAPSSAPLAPNSTSAQRGDVDCPYGALDCNICACNVPDQFYAAFDRGMVWKSCRWHFQYNSRYAPSQDKARRVLDSSRDSHVQGFVRTNNETIRYAMSHSHSTDKGGYFFIEKSPQRNELKSMHRSKSGYPKSVAELGQYVISAEDDMLRVFDLRRLLSKQTVEYRVPDFNAGGGLAMTKLADGSYLLVASFKGSQNDPEMVRYTDFFRVEGSIDRPRAIRHLARVPYSQPTSWKGNYQYSDNLSLITECGTGQLYTIHTSGEGDRKTLFGLVPRDLIDPDGYWRLSRVDWDVTTGQPRLTTLAARWQDSSYSECHHRSSATVHVGMDHVLEFYCHERRVFKTFGENDESFGFRYGRPR